MHGIGKNFPSMLVGKAEGEGTKARTSEDDIKM